MFDPAELPEPVIYTIDTHQAWQDFKALLLHWNDRERAQQGLPPLEIEIAQQNAALIQTRSAATE